MKRATGFIAATGLCIAVTMQAAQAAPNVRFDNCRMVHRQAYTAMRDRQSGLSAERAYTRSYSDIWRAVVQAAYRQPPVAEPDDTAAHEFADQLYLLCQQQNHALDPSH